MMTGILHDSNPGGTMSFFHPRNPALTSAMASRSQSRNGRPKRMFRIQRLRLRPQLPRSDICSASEPEHSIKVFCVLFIGSVNIMASAIGCLVFNNNEVMIGLSIGTFLVNIALMLGALYHKRELLVPWLVYYTLLFVFCFFVRLPAVDENFGSIPAEVNSTVVPMILSVIIVSCMLGVYNLLNSFEQQALAHRATGGQFQDQREAWINFNYGLNQGEGGQRRFSSVSHLATISAAIAVLEGQTHRLHSFRPDNSPPSYDDLLRREREQEAKEGFDPPTYEEALRMNNRPKSESGSLPNVPESGANRFDSNIVLGPCQNERYFLHECV